MRLLKNKAVGTGLAVAGGVLAATAIGDLADHYLSTSEDKNLNRMKYISRPIKAGTQAAVTQALLSAI